MSKKDKKYNTFEDSAKRTEFKKNIEYKEPMLQLNFDAWFTKVANERKFNSNLKEALKLHFEVNGFMENKKFDEGLKHFGF
jgi:hypothetical protein